ncbi:MAG TPA: SMC-Scp complex subunit ScpB [Thermoplasmataceae archaeon]|nr:SMC-Scp complex subunit ScpB [Thermoplasmatales archaeon AK]HLH86515.1 SMC-Scp complex subunit ScpB [Thermoplasmataceae archaeon]
MNLLSKIEAVLYASESALSVNDIASVLGEDPALVSKELKRLIREYSRRDSALQIARTGITYKIQLRKEFVPVVSPVSKKEFDRLDLEILGFIAANDGCIRGDIINRYGEKARPHIEVLKSRKFISIKKYRNTEKFSVTKEFFRYFSITPEKLKEMVAGTGVDKVE